MVKTQGFKSHVQEGTLSSLIYERVCRVCAQPPTGSISALTQHDVGKSRLMNLVWNSYILPNANSQFQSEIKSWLWDYYSLVFGAMPAIHFYRADDEYVGPDWRVLNPRFVFSQAGRLTPSDCDYMFVDSFHSISELKKWRKKNEKAGYKKEALDKLIEKAKNEAGSGANVSQEETSDLQNERGEATDFAKNQPMTGVIDAMRQLFLGREIDSRNLIIALIWLLAIMLIFWTLAGIAYKNRLDFRDK